VQQSQIRVWISGRVKVLLSHFWRPDDPVEVEEALLRDWVECLKDFTTDEINTACRAYLARPERSEAGRAIRPGPWIIVRMIERQRAHDQAIRRKASPPDTTHQEVKREVVSPDRARKIMAEVGLDILPEGTGKAMT